MKTLATLSGVIVLGCGLVHADSERPPPSPGFRKVQKVLTAAKTPWSLQRMLKDLGLIEEWSKEEDAKLLIGIEGDWGSLLRVYKAPGLKKVNRISFLGTPKDRTEQGRAQFDVVYVCIDEKEWFHVFRWIDGRYKHEKSAEVTWDRGREE